MLRHVVKVFVERMDDFFKECYSFKNHSRVYHLSVIKSCQLLVPRRSVIKLAIFLFNMK